MKHIEISMYVPMIIASVIRELHEPQHHKPSKQSPPRGEVLMYKGAICDARFSKCCGGAFEEFQNCWENVKHPYLIRQRDSKTEKQLPDLNIEAEADKWIRTSPVAFVIRRIRKF